MEKQTSLTSQVWNEGQEAKWLACEEPHKMSIACSLSSLFLGNARYEIMTFKRENVELLLEGYDQKSWITFLFYFFMLLSTRYLFKLY